MADEDLRRRKPTDSASYRLWDGRKLSVGREGEDVTLQLRALMQQVIETQADVQELRERLGRLEERP
jgi:hypothetical protein